jgi:hypothetical protein
LAAVRKTWIIICIPLFNSYSGQYIRKELVEASGFIAITAEEGFLPSPYPFREGPYVEV